MSRIPAVVPAQAEGRAKELLDGIQKAFGGVPNLYRVTARSPASLDGLLGLTNALAHGTLDRKLTEQIAIAVAERNGCDYCLSAHTMLGKRAGLTDAELVQARGAKAVDGKSEAALHFVALVVDQAGQVGDGELARIREAGFSDGEIVELVANAALNVFTNTLNNVAATDIDFPRVSPAAGRPA
jgi:uncharacterized peroxidase-related enzyme